MGQADCVRVQTAQLGIQKAARKGLLPLELGRLVAVLRASEGPLPIALNREERLLIAAHLETCDACRTFWQEQLKLGDLLGEVGFDLPPEATTLETTRLQERVLELSSATSRSGRESEMPRAPRTPSEKPAAVVSHGDYVKKKREVRVSTQYQAREIALVAAGALIVVLAIFYFAYVYPPVQQEDVQGAIGKRDVYRETNMTEQDVTAKSGPGGPSYAGLVELLKSPEFKALANNSNYQTLVGNQTAFTQLTNNNSFHALCNQLVGNQGNALVNSIIVLVNSGLSQNNAFNQLSQSQQFQQAVANSSNFHELTNSLSTNSTFQSLAHNNQFNQLMNNAAFYSFIHQNAHSLSDLSSMVNNSAFQQLAQNANALQNLVQNSAFNSLINNQSFQFLNLVSSLQNNAAFNGLVTNTNFVGLVNSSEFAGLAGNQLFQQLLQDSNFHQVLLSQEQGSLANNSQFNQLVNSSQYHSLATNNQFQSLLHNSNFNNLVNNAAFHNLIQNNQFALFLSNSQLASYASSAGLQTLMQQSNQLGANLF